MPRSGIAKERVDLIARFAPSPSGGTRLRSSPRAAACGDLLEDLAPAQGLDVTSGDLLGATDHLLAPGAIDLGRIALGDIVVETGEQLDRQHGAFFGGKGQDLGPQGRRLRAHEPTLSLAGGRGRRDQRRNRRGQGSVGLAYSTGVGAWRRCSGRGRLA